MIPYFKIEKFYVFNVWGLFFGLAFFIGLLLLVKFAKKNKLEISQIYDLSFFTLIGALFLSRLTYVLQFPKNLLKNPLIFFKIWQGGLTSWGGILGGIIFGFLYLKLKKIEHKKILNLISLILPISFAIGRIGCFLIKDHKGAETNLPFGIMWNDGIIRHPVALYLILGNLIIFFVLFFLKNKIKIYNNLFLIWAILYSIMRFLLDFTRVKKDIFADPSFMNLTYAQWIYGIVSIVLLLTFLKKFK